MRFPVAVMLLSGCGAASSSSGERAPVTLHFHFADGRRCAEAGALQIQITTDDSAAIICQPATCSVLCSDGESPSGVSLSVVTNGARLRFTAVSAQMDPLYRGTLALSPPLPADAEVELYFTGGR